MCKKPAIELELEEDAIRRNREEVLWVLRLFEQMAEERKSDPNSAFYINEQ